MSSYSGKLLGLKDRVPARFYPRTKVDQLAKKLAWKRGVSYSRFTEEALEEKIERELPHSQTPKIR